MKNGKGLEIAKRIVLGKIEGQNQVLRKFGLRQFDFSMIEKVRGLKVDSLGLLRMKLSTYEAHCSRIYFKRIFSLFSESLRPEHRRTFKAYDGLNNLFNLGYELLSWKVHKALVNAKLEPFLGFLHSEQFGKPSLVCDFMELYRFLIDDFLVQYYGRIGKSSFVAKYEALSRRKVGKREYLNDDDSKVLMRGLNRFFECKVEIARVKHGKRQSLETLISEEALLLAEYLRGKRKEWNPRIVSL